MTNALVVMLASPEDVNPPIADTIADAAIAALAVIPENISQVTVAVAVIAASAI
jgi:hypothetical protein